MRRSSAWAIEPTWRSNDFRSTERAADLLLEELRAYPACKREFRTYPPNRANRPWSFRTFWAKHAENRSSDERERLVDRASREPIPGERHMHRVLLPRVIHPVIGRSGSTREDNKVRSPARQVHADDYRIACRHLLRDPRGARVVIDDRGVPRDVQSRVVDRPMPVEPAGVRRDRGRGDRAQAEVRVHHREVG